MVAFPEKKGPASLITLVEEEFATGEIRMRRSPAPDPSGAASHPG